MNALVIGAGEHYENAYSPFNEEMEVEFDDENNLNGEQGIPKPSLIY